MTEQQVSNEIKKIIANANEAKNTYESCISLLKQKCSEKCHKAGLNDEKKISELWDLICENMALHFDPGQFKVIYEKHLKLIKIFLSSK